MPYLFAMVQTLVLGRFIRRSTFFCVWMAALCSSFFVVGCGSVVTDPVSTESAELKFVKEQLRPLCFKPSEVAAAEANGDEDIFFAFVETTGEAVTSRDRWVLDQALLHDGFVFKYDVNAPIANLRLVPLSRAADAWCSRIPRPTDAAALALLDPCSGAASTACKAPAAKSLFGQTVASPYSPFFCEKRPRMAPTTQESISLFQRSIAYMSAREQARKIAKALTQAEADMESVLNKDRGWLKRAFTTDPGSIEQILQRVAAQLDSIEAAPDYGQCELDMLAMSGFNDGFAEGKFDVQAKLFAIDASIFVLEVIALEIVMGPLGGAKHLASAVSKGAKAVTTVANKASPLFEFASTKSGQLLSAAMKRLENIPIFIPGAAGGAGGFVKAGNAIKSVSQRHVRRLEKAMFAEAEKWGVKLTKLGTEETHHIVPPGSNRPFAQKCREKLQEFGVDVDDAANGVFLPANKKSPNPRGSIVHKILGSNDVYYEKVYNHLAEATSHEDLILRLRRIGETLNNGTFFNARL